MTRFETDAIHAGQEPDELTGAVVPAIYQTSTYKQDGVGGLRGGYEYSRSGNPTRTALEVNLAALENGQFAFATSSGLAAEDLILRAILKPGDHIIAPIDAYGGSYRLINKVYTPWGISHTAVDQYDLVALEEAIQPGKTKAIWVETPTNPLLSITDIEAIANLAKANDLVVIVDNTFSSPYLQQPLTLGADIVIHSTTKYLGGHSDVIGGAVITNNPELAQQIGFLHNAMGPVAGPLDSWLVLRGIKTLGVRMDRHTSNAKAIVEFLQSNSQVEQIFYPGLPEHKGHEIAKRQMRDFGGMVSFRVKGGQEKALDICNRVKIFTLAESLGGVESLIEHPGKMTHASVAGSALEVPADLIRLSVGIEHIDDLIEDLAQAF
ncbi:MAG: cystathionine gamma-synthase [Actinomycetales bacterium]|nr:cystathionine gamma-synthase [Actinomycetales bacterium]